MSLNADFQPIHEVAPDVIFQDNGTEIPIYSDKTSKFATVFACPAEQVG